MGLLDYDLELAKAKARQIYDTLKANSPLPGMADAMSQYQSPVAAIYSNADRLKRRVVDTLSNPMAQAQRTVGQIADNPQEFSNQLANNFAPAAMTVWHGSPHKFNKFDMSKIGTGEGAQAYGHGLYMAEAQPVAQEYADALGKEVLLKGKPAYQAKTGAVAADLPVSNGAAGHLRMNDWDLQKALKMAEDDFVETGDQWFSKVHQELSTLKPEDIQINRGQMYKVDIPDEAVAKFLDWDKPLSQQAPEVQSALGKYSIPDKNMTGQEINSYLMQVAADNSGQVGVRPSFYKQFSGDASRLMRESGIPGIRYLDGGSRGQQAGTSNFVLFDDQMPRILEINGSPTGNKPWSPGEWRGLLGE